MLLKKLRLGKFCWQQLPVLRYGAVSDGILTIYIWLRKNPVVTFVPLIGNIALEWQDTERFVFADRVVWSTNRKSQMLLPKKGKFRLDATAQTEFPLHWLSDGGRH
jgi:hypothetical protein